MLLGAVFEAQTFTVALYPLAQVEEKTASMEGRGMTYKEASKAFGDEVPDLSLETLELAKKAVEKQIPKKPIYWHYCAVCASDINGIKGSGNYCFRCGQAIDWSDDNGGA